MKGVLLKCGVAARRAQLGHRLKPSRGSSVRERDAYGQAVEHLRRLLRSGRFVQGEPLVTTELAFDLGLSPTPVREALARLAGEGLIEDRRGAGFFSRILGPLEVRELYQIHGTLLGSALKGAAFAHGELVQGAPPLPDETGPLRSERVFARLAAQSPSRTAREHLARLSDRMAPVFHVEAQVLDGVDGELERLARAAFGSAELLASIHEHHARRETAAEALAWAVRARADAFNEI